MEWMNYHHLMYFWIAAREGSISAAGEVLQLSAPTVSGQINLLEEALGQKLFKRAGRGLVLTDAGKLVYRYADEIFSLGHALQQEVKGKSQLIARRLHVGITLGVPDLLAQRILQPVFKSAKEWKVVTHTGNTEDLLGLLAMRAIDVLISDAPAGNPKLNIWSHLLFESGTTIFATAKSARSLKNGFPKSLSAAHFFLPAESAASRRDLDSWLESKNAKPPAPHHLPTNCRSDLVPWFLAEPMPYVKRSTPSPRNVNPKFRRLRPCSSRNSDSSTRFHEAQTIGALLSS
jgi:LysR family transcriptional activator of nhaA